MTKRGKRYREVYRQTDRSQAYTPQEAVELARQQASARFPETVELHLRTASDPRHSDQLVRGVCSLPHGLGKSMQVLVFASGEGALLAQEASADFVGDEDLIKRIEGGWLEFDVAIATPDMMGRIGRLGRFLGRRGLMPNPRTGTVVAAEDLPRAIAEAKKGRLEFRMDRTAVIHAPIGKATFESRQLLDNLATFVDAVQRARPSGVKGQFIRSAYLTTTMGPSIKLDLASLLALRVE
ncbi:MAG: 50S ribosomal protein L1 [Dehalococcoidia bacterium]